MILEVVSKNLALLGEMWRASASRASDAAPEVGGDASHLLRGTARGYLSAARELEVALAHPHALEANPDLRHDFKLDLQFPDDGSVEIPDVIDCQLCGLSVPYRSDEAIIGRLSRCPARASVPTYSPKSPCRPVIGGITPYLLEQQNAWSGCGLASDQGFRFAPPHL